MQNSQRTVVLLGATLLFGWLLSPLEATAQKKPVGGEEFRAGCASCHGLEGRGDGPMAKFLTVKPSDLTQLARKSEGSFPFTKVFEMIDGRQLVGAHGTRAMPIWGDRYQVEAAVKYGPAYTETFVRGRILELVQYLEAIQE